MAKINTDPNSVDQKTLIDNINMLENEKAILKQENEKLKLSVADSANLVSQLKEELSKHTADSDKLRNEHDSQVEQLKADNTELKRMLADLQEKLVNEQNNVHNKNEEGDKLRKEADDNFRAANAATMKNDKLEAEIADLKAKLTEAETAQKGIKLKPFTSALAEALAKKLSERYKTNITAQNILEDYLIRYNVQKFSEWFHPFVLKDQEIEDILHRFNADLTLRSYRSMLNNGRTQDED